MKPARSLPESPLATNCRLRSESAAPANCFRVNLGSSIAIIDTRTLPDEGVIETDICVIGSGAAGLAIAARLQGRKQSVAVLESGGLEPDAATQSLYRGENIGLPHAPLDTARLRFFGGTTNHWTAHVRKLEPIDFAQRSWVPHSGWPFSRETLEPFYEDARKFLGLSESAFQLAPWMARGRQPWHFEADRVRTQLREVVAERYCRFGPRFKDTIANSDNVDVYLHANVTRINLEPSRKRVASVRIATLSGKRRVVHARQYVLATGGIENPRLLLLSSIGEDTGSGPSQVGRYYANHPETMGGSLVLVNPQPWMIRSFRPVHHRGGMTLPLLRLARAVQETQELLDAALPDRPIQASRSEKATERGREASR